MKGPTAAASASSDNEAQQLLRSRRAGRRRVTQAGPEGSDPHPFDPPEEPRSVTENDDQLRADKPPHWG